MKILPLTGLKSLRALNVFHSLLLGLKMLPINLSEDYVSFFESFKAKSEEEKESSLRQALAFVPLGTEELDAVLSFVVDDNGVSYSAQRSKSLSPVDIFEMVIAVCKEIGGIKISLVSEEEKKRFQTLASI